jgi:hypothetical protein
MRDRQRERKKRERKRERESKRERKKKNKPGQVGFVFNICPKGAQPQGITPFIISENFDSPERLEHQDRTIHKKERAFESELVFKMIGYFRACEHSSDDEDAQQDGNPRRRRGSGH